MTKLFPTKQLLSPNFKNLERLCRHHTSHKLDLKSTPQPQSQQQPIYYNQNTQTTEIVVKDIAKPYKLIRRQKAPHKKVDKVVGYL